jgi:lipid A oxidase
MLRAPTTFGMPERRPVRFTLAHDRICAIVGLLALGGGAIAWETGAWTPPEVAALDAMAMTGADPTAGGAAGSVPSGGVAGQSGREILAGGYMGVAHTHQSTVEIKNPGRTDMTVRDFNWIGRPFKAPVYYGLRAITWPESARVGAMLDFTHAKAIAVFDDIGTFSGTYEGKPLPPKARMGDVFKHLEFSHGHNMVTLNALARLGRFRVQPYVGAGAGISLPHTEVAFRDEKGRTYEYQYAGLVGQALVGFEVPLGRVSVFVEYKFSYAPYDVPLSGVNGWLLVTDVWRQFKAWAGRETPPQGRLRTTLLTHHAIGGVLVRATAASPAR